MTGRVHAVGKAARWDERRNTSKVQPVPPDALPNALRALAAYRRERPDVYAYIAAGSPPIRTQEDHVRWFGRPYVKPGRKSQEPCGPESPATALRPPT